MNGSESQGKLDSSRQITKVKNYQVTTISMSRKNSVKSMETSNQRGQFKNKIIGNRARNVNSKRNNIRLGMSNDTHNSSKISEKSNRQNKIIRKRRKHPSESIDSTRNINEKYGSTLKLFANCSNKINKSFNSTIVCHRKFESTLLKVKKPPVNISHNEIDEVPSKLSKYKRSTTSCDKENEVVKGKKKQLTEANPMNVSMIARRPSGILRPKTSLGRNHSLYANTKRFNNS